MSNYKSIKMTTKIEQGLSLLTNKVFYFAFMIIWILGIENLKAQNQKNNSEVFSKSNLAAWCIVPFDAEHRGPEERAKMLHDLGITKLAYDWRDKDIPTFDQELAALNKYNIKLEAFWMMSGINPENNNGVQKIFEFLERNQVKTQIWLMMSIHGDEFDALDQEAKVAQMAKPISYIAKRAEKIGCKVGLYNHEGWFGEPENQLAIIEYLKLTNVGMVYNFHHARMQHERFPEFFPKIKPHLYAINIAGLKTGDVDKFYRVGQGDVEAEMIKLVWESGYTGTIGILNHDEKEDAKKGLTDEMNGLKKILKELGNKKALRSF